MSVSLFFAAKPAQKAPGKFIFPGLAQFFADSSVNLRLPQKKAAQSSRKPVGGWVLPTFYGGRRVNKFLPHRRQIPVSEENSAFPTKVGGGGYSNE